MTPNGKNTTHPRVPIEDDIFLTPAEVARFLRISVSTLKKMIHQNKIRALKTPGGHYRIYKRELVENYYKGGPASQPAAAGEKPEEGASL